MQPFIIERIENMDEACLLVREHKLFLSDENLSHTMFVLQQHEERVRFHSPLLGAWFARDLEGRIMGCALVAEGLGFTDGSPTVSLFVSADWRSRGVGAELLDRALSRFPEAWGFHTPEAEKLYSRKGLETAFFSLDMVETPELHSHSRGRPRP